MEEEKEEEVVELCTCGRPASPRSYVKGLCTTCGFVAHCEGY